jgi:hypothetical protein
MIIAEGPPETIAATAASYTGHLSEAGPRCGSEAARQDQRQSAARRARAEGFR